MNDQGYRECASLASAENHQTICNREWKFRAGSSLDTEDLFDWEAYCAARDTGRDIEEDRPPPLEAGNNTTRNSSENSMKLTGVGSCPYDDRTLPGIRGLRAQVQHNKSGHSAFWVKLPRSLVFGSGTSAATLYAPIPATRESWHSETKPSAWRPGGACLLCRLGLPSKDSGCHKHEWILPVFDREHLCHWDDNSKASRQSSLRFLASCSLLQSRASAGVVNYASILAGGIATVAILNSPRYTPGICPALGNDHRWPSMLPLLVQLPEGLRCPGLPAYLAAVSTYSAVGLLHLVKGPQYWADCALVAVVASVLTGVAWGGRAMVDALVLGGFLSLVCCKVLGRLMGTREQGAGSLRGAN